MERIIKIKKLNDAAVIPFKKHDNDFCYDVVAVSEEQVAPNVWKYGLGMAIEIERSDMFYTDANYGITFRPRSSVWKTGMILSNCIGTIDEGYRGEISAVFYHVMPGMPRYKVGDRIGQIHFESSPPLMFEVVNELGKTDRGDGGYGSTGQ